MQLTKNFALDEFLVSDTAVAIGVANEPTAEHLKRLSEVTAPGMQIIRDLVQRSIVITSAYRNPRVNKAVGGTPTSDHPQAWAVDSRAAGLSAYGYASIIAEAMKAGGALHGKVDQLILETGRNIVHVSFAPRKRGHIRTQKGGPGSAILEGLRR